MLEYNLKRDGVTLAKAFVSEEDYTEYFLYIENNTRYDTEQDLFNAITNHNTEVWNNWNILPDEIKATIAEPDHDWDLENEIVYSLV